MVLDLPPEQPRLLRQLLLHLRMRSPPLLRCGPPTCSSPWFSSLSCATSLSSCAILSIFLCLIYTIGWTSLHLSSYLHLVAAILFLSRFLSSLYLSSSSESAAPSYQISSLSAPPPTPTPSLGSPILYTSILNIICSGCSNLVQTLSLHLKLRCLFSKILSN